MKVKKQNQLAAQRRNQTDLTLINLIAMGNQAAVQVLPKNQLAEQRKKSKNVVIHAQNHAAQKKKLKNVVMLVQNHAAQRVMILKQDIKKLLKKLEKLLQIMKLLQNKVIKDYLD